MEKVNSNLLLCIFSLIFVIVVIKYNNLTFKEHFAIKNVTAYNILPNLNEKSYIGTFIPNSKENYNGNLITTNSLKSGKWEGPILNGMPEKNSIIVDLCYNSDNVE